MNALEQSLLNTETGCIQVLQQVAAIKGAINGLMNELIETHLREHVIGEATVNEEELAEFLKLLKRYG
ncbi:metal-sensing transcriptional repressor [Acinetobacter variabilis]